MDKGGLVAGDPGNLQRLVAITPAVLLRRRRKAAFSIGLQSKKFDRISKQFPRAAVGHAECMDMALAVGGR